MWRYYGTSTHRYPKISLSEERRLISEAQKGSKKSRDEIVFRHISFLKFRFLKERNEKLSQGKHMTNLK